MKIINKNTREMRKSLAHLTSLPTITLKFDTFSPPHRDLLREKVKTFSI
jgi:hypothetical protein